MFTPVQQNWQIYWGAKTAVGYFYLLLPSLFLESVCGILFWFMLRIVFEDLEYFSFYYKFFDLYASCSCIQSRTEACICGFLSRTVMYSTWVALIHSHIQALALELLG